MQSEISKIGIVFSCFFNVSLKSLLSETLNQGFSLTRETFILLSLCQVKRTVSGLIPELIRSQMCWRQWIIQVLWMWKTGFITKMPHSNRAGEHIQHNRTNCENAQSAQNFALHQSACSHL